jgi:protein gp37
MANNSSIEWTEATWNPLAGCTPVSPGCLNCYAATMAYRLEKMGQAKYAGLTVLRNGVRTFNGTIRTAESDLEAPLRRKTPTVYFVNSMSDLFHKDVPFEFIDKVFAVMALTPQHTYQVLTKRPERMAEYFEDGNPGNWDEAIDSLPNSESITIDNDHETLETRRDHTDEYYTAVRRGKWPLPNVWLGTSVENQEQADLRIPHLLQVPAVVRFLSIEPLLGPIDFQNADRDGLRGGMTGAIHWMIVGGESGGSKKSPARPCDIKWIRSIVKQCADAGVPCFVKQIGSRPIMPYCDATGAILKPEMAPSEVQCKAKDRKGGNPNDWPEDLRVRQMPLAP